MISLTVDKVEPKPTDSMHQASKYVQITGSTFRYHVADGSIKRTRLCHCKQNRVYAYRVWAVASDESGYLVGHQCQRQTINYPINWLVLKWERYGSGKRKI